MRIMISEHIATNQRSGEILRNVGQERAPIYEALIAYQQRHNLPLHTPGHKGVASPAALQRFLTPLGLACDLPSMDATDNWFHPQSCIAEALRLAAELYEVADTFYLVNGSTIGVQAMILAAVAPGEKILIARNFHMSAFSALVLSGAVPVYLPLKWQESIGPIPPTAQEIEYYLCQHPDIRAVFLVHPTYYGVGRSLGALVDVCRQHRIPLLIDEAHGAHLRFLPSGNLRSAVAYGADLVVQSVHKTVGSLVGTAQLHRCNGSLVSSERLQSMLNLLQSTSSNYLLLASLDLTRRWMWQEGNDLFQQSVEHSTLLQRHLNAIPGIRTLNICRHPDLSECSSDPLRLVVNVSDLGLSGFYVEQWLEENFQIQDEFCDAKNVAFILGPADTPGIYKQLEHAFTKLSAEHLSCMRGSGESIYCMPTPPLALTPRSAAFLPKARMPLEAASGSICGETITVYPPGIPLICQGELFTGEIIDYCQQLLAQQAYIFANDASLKTVTVVLDETRSSIAEAS